MPLVAFAPAWSVPTEVLAPAEVFGTGFAAVCTTFFLSVATCFEVLSVFFSVADLFVSIAVFDLLSTEVPRLALLSV